MKKFSKTVKLSWRFPWSSSFSFSYPSILYTIKFFHEAVQFSICLSCFPQNGFPTLLSITMRKYVRFACNRLETHWRHSWFIWRRFGHRCHMRRVHLPCFYRWLVDTPCFPKLAVVSYPTLWKTFVMKIKHTPRQKYHYWYIHKNTVNGQRGTGLSHWLMSQHALWVSNSLHLGVVLCFCANKKGCFEWMGAIRHG